jgi:hypothetical protein
MSIVIPSNSFSAGCGEAAVGKGRSLRDLRAKVLGVHTHFFHFMERKLYMFRETINDKP